MHQPARRNSRIEGLRIVAMCMIITLHYLGQGGVLDAVRIGDGVFGVAWLLESFCYGAVNCFILISGYFLCTADRYSPKKMIHLVFQALFYSLGLYAVFCFLGVETFSVKTLIGGYLFPITHGQYWYVTAYLVSLLTVPYISRIMKGLTQKEHRKLLIEFGVAFSVIPTANVLFSDTFGLSGGYSLIWFMYLYFVAGYIRKYGVPLARWKLLIGYVGFSLIPFLTKFAQLRILGKEYWNFYQYNSVFILLSAVCLFSWVIRLRATSHPIVNSIAGTTLGVFLFHTHFIMVDTVLWKEIIKPDRCLRSPLQLIVHLACSVVVIFFAGSVVDYLRKLIFDGISRLWFHITSRRGNTAKEEGE